MIIGGVSFSTVLSLFIVPVLYMLLARFTKPSSYVADRLRTLEEEQLADGAVLPSREAAGAPAE